MAETDFYQICHCDKTKAKTVTMILEEKSIADGSYISPPGHSSTIKNVQQIENKNHLTWFQCLGKDGR